MKKFNFAIFCLGVLLFISGGFSCSQPDSGADTTTIPAGSTGIKLEFKKGSAGGAAAIYVAWLEKPSDNFLQNLTICRRLRGIGGSLTNTALPFWKVNRYPVSNAAEVDAVTGVTKTTNFTVIRVLKDSNQKKFTCYFEMDHSFDPNDWFHENTSGKDDDQPAITYAVDIDLDNPQNVYTLNFIGWAPNEGTVGTFPGMTVGGLETEGRYITHTKASGTFGVLDNRRATRLVDEIKVTIIRP